MLSVFNRKALLVTNSMERQSSVAQQLSRLDIPYFIKITKLSAGGNSSAFWLQAASNSPVYEYCIFVKKKDYEKACHLILL